MIKIAVCIPSFNESENIENITRQVDMDLNCFEEEVNAVIVNCDNNSPDLTNQLFNQTETVHKKISIVSNDKGKGINIFNFFNFFIENDYDYGFTIDADLKSFKLDWINKMYQKLKEDNDFVLPLYKRRKEEGNTTNHFIGPMLYRIYGKFVRQPIGGDYGFNKKYVKIIMQRQFTENILKYGIDIFMVVTAIYHNLSIEEVNLGDKVHSPSYSNMENIFESVLKGFSEVYMQYNKKTINHEKINYIPFEYDIKECEFRNEMEQKYIMALNRCNLTKEYNMILKNWIYMLKRYEDEIENLSQELIENMKDSFICRVVSFWDEINKRNINKWEIQLIEELYKKEGEY